ncbi:MAG: hypothetical protein ACOZNI_05835 [Myxococcota bacterium]
MSTRDELARRGVRPEDVDDVVEIAAELQARREARAREVGAEEIRRVAAEVDVDPALVEDAIAELGRRRAEAERKRTESAAASAAREARLQKALLAVAGGLAVLIAALFLLTVKAGNDVARVRAAEEVAAAALTAQLERQATLAPQVLALAGTGADVADEIAAVRGAGDVDARVAASRALTDELTAALAKLPPPSNDRDADMRLNLSYELTGTQNRIATETRRWQEARRATEQAERAGLAPIATKLGLGD